ncbi:MAG: hypothetical protein Q8R36_00790 [bacterium]|nr:hypothetical protein [bacterium]
MHQKGFAPLIIIVIVTLVIGAGVGGFLVLREKKIPSFENEKTVQQEVPLEDIASPIEPTPSPVQSIQPPSPKTQPEPKPKSAPLQPTQVTASPTAPTPQSPSSACKGRGTVNFTSPPMRIEEIGHIWPIGLMNASSGHITPTDHGYYHPPNWKPQEAEDASKFKDILSPADGVITGIGSIGNRVGDYRMVIHHTCTFYTIYIHLRELSPKILGIIGKSTKNINTNIPVVAGEVIGRANGSDFSVHNEEATLKGFVVPEHYSEPWKIHTVDMFDYFLEPIKSQLLSKNVRQAEPRGGKIDYDIDGRLVGNWFVENTGGYRGGGYGGAEPYWATHLVFAYDSIVPSLVWISMGNYGGEAKGFAVKGNLPDPANVSVANGLLKYELVSAEYKTDTGQFWDRISFAKVTSAIETNFVEGVVLVQMISDRKIKFEAFPGKTGAEVSGFTSAARVYER